MTGQGDRNYERIKKARFSGAVLDVSQQFKTKNGLPVRQLRVELTNRKVIGGRVVTVAHSHHIITGQVKVKHEWMDAEWNAQGIHPQEQYSLEVVKETQAQQANLF